ncbi:hypothetical protein WKW77_32195 [Variovorax ureilyticus]|uniref:Uncharacterized protein n=1 Tax=Variovorax ureilyticus TaxID=1836198 RepID=A0ABU8VQ48_9BURK
MAKTDRKGGRSSNVSKSGKRKAVGRRRSTDAAFRKSARRKVSDAALLVEDEFNNLRAAHRAYDCVQNLLTPLSPLEVDEFRIHPLELSALMEVVNAEMVRRIQTVTDAIESVREALH